MQRSIFTLLLSLSVAEVTCAFESSMIFAALATLYKTYRDPIGVGWMLSGFQLVAAVAAPICARLGDMYGRKRVLCYALTLSGVGSLVSLFSETLTWVVIGRAIQGISAAVLPLCYGIVREQFPKEKQAWSVGIIAATAFVGAGVGVLLGGVIVDYLPWKSIFLISALFTAVSILLAIGCVPSVVPQKLAGTIDVLGGVLFMGAVGTVLYGIAGAKGQGWLSRQTLTVMGVGAAITAVWVWYELRRRDPLIDVRQLGDRQIVLANLTMGMAALGAMQFSQVVILMLQQPAWTLVGLGLSATVTGFIKIPSNVAGLFGAPWSGWIASRSGARRAALIGWVMMITGWAALTANHSSVPLIVCVSIVSQLGLAMVYAAIPNLILEVAPANRTSEATGLMQVSRAAFGAVGAQVVAFFLATSTVSDPQHGAGIYPSGAAYMLTLTVITMTCVAGLLLTLFLPKRVQAVAMHEGLSGSVAK